ncbi:Cytochrome P450 1A4, partial [Struthio camelus australis]
KAAMSLGGSQGIISATEILIVAAVFCLVFLLIQSFRQHVPKGLKRPPGPRGYPILGNVLELRKDPHLALTKLSQKYGDVMEIRIGSESDYLVTKCLQVIEEEKSFDPYRYLVISVANVICAMCFGRRYDHNDQELLSLVNLNNEFGEVAAAGNPTDFIPVLQYLPSRAMKAFKDLNRRFSSFVQKIVQQHYTSFDREHIRDITDSLIEHCQETKAGENTGVPLSSKQIINIVNDLFGAGFDTVTTALSWSLMYLALYPDIQKRIQEEIDHTIGQERRPRLSDRGTLPRTEAFILEMFRHSSFLPFTIPHCTTKDTVLNGYYIPKDCCVFINQWQVNHDEKVQDDKRSGLNPSFLEGAGSAAGTKIDRNEADKVMTFGLGKRRCIGESIGRLEVFLFLATLLQQLEFSLCAGEEVDITPQYGLTMKYKKCKHFQIKKRFPVKSS